MRMAPRVTALVTATTLLIAASPVLSPEADAAPTTSNAFSQTYLMKVATGMTPRAASPSRVTAELPERRGNFDMAAVTWATGSMTPNARIEYSVKRGTKWSPWESLPAGEPSGAASGREGTEPIYTGAATSIKVRILGAPRVAQPQVTLISTSSIPHHATGAHTSSAGPSTQEIASAKATATVAGGAGADAVYQANGGTFGATATSTRSVPVHLAGVVRRAGWGANEKWVGKTGDRSCLFFNPKLRGAVIHHTAGTNSYTRAEAPAIVRGIYYYHAVTLDWCDIGYNFLIDQYGTIYEGRADSLYRAAHGAHAKYANTESVGVSVMMNSDSAPLSGAAFESLARVTSYKINKFALNPFAYTTYYEGKIAHRTQVVTGHQFTGIPTGCPGTDMTRKLSALRYRVNTLNLANQVTMTSNTLPASVARSAPLTFSTTMSRSVNYRFSVERLNPDGSVTTVYAGTRKVGNPVKFTWSVSGHPAGLNKFRVRMAPNGWTTSTTAWQTVNVT